MLAAWYLLTAVRKLMYGSFNPANAGLRDMNGREIVIGLSLVVLFLVIGLFPNLFFEKINPATTALAEQVKAITALAQAGN